MDTYKTLYKLMSTVLFVFSVAAFFAPSQLLRFGLGLPESKHVILPLLVQILGLFSFALSAATCTAPMSRSSSLAVAYAYCFIGLGFLSLSTNSQVRELISLPIIFIISYVFATVGVVGVFYAPEKTQVSTGVCPFASMHSAYKTDKKNGEENKSESAERYMKNVVNKDGKHD